MKKIVSLIVAVGLACVCAFAEVDLSLNYTFSPLNKQKWEMSGEMFGGDPDSKVDFEASELMFAGADLNFDCFFVDAGIVGIGANLNTGINFYNKMSIKQTMGEMSMSDDPDLDSGLDWKVKIGPAFNFKFTDMFNLYAAPGFRFDLFSLKQKGTNKNGEAYKKMSTMEFMFDIDVGARLWFSEHFGANLGVNYAIGGAGKLKSGDDTMSDKGKLAQSFDVYAGVCVKF